MRRPYSETLAKVRALWGMWVICGRDIDQRGRDDQNWQQCQQEWGQRLSGWSGREG